MMPNVCMMSCHFKQATSFEIQADPLIHSKNTPMKINKKQTNRLPFSVETTKSFAYHYDIKSASLQNKLKKELGLNLFTPSRIFSEIFVDRQQGGQTTMNMISFMMLQCTIYTCLMTLPFYS